MAETAYARAGDVSLAYQVVGEGDLDLLLILGFPTHVELAWENHGFARMAENLGRFARIILFDRRGAGLSDPAPGVPLLEDRVADIDAVLDAAGSERAAIVAIGEGGLAALMFAAVQPERVSSLILIGCYPRMTQTDDYPIGWEPAEYLATVERLAEGWGSGAFICRLFPTLAADPLLRDWAARYERYGASPGVALACLRSLRELDVRDILASIHVPTLVVHRTGDPVHTVGHARYLAEHIPSAQLLELPGDFVGTFFDMSPEETLEIAEFLTGHRGAVAERVLATMLFTDIVGSTEAATRLGDRAWRDLLEQHNAIVRRALDRYGGREVNTIGDGFVATFDGPARGVRCALTIVEDVRSLGIEVRAGLHIGEVEVVGSDVRGIAVHTAARIAAKAGASEVLVSRTVVDLVAGSGVEFDDRGEHDLKGIAPSWHLFAARAPAYDPISGSLLGAPAAPLR